jgi:hypothetical protein
MAVFKRKSLDDHVRDYKLKFGRYEDSKLEDVDNEYLDWVLNDYKYRGDWDRKIIVRYQHLVAEEFHKQQEVDRDRDFGEVSDFF